MLKPAYLYFKCKCGVSCLEYPHTHDTAERFASFSSRVRQEIWPSYQVEPKLLTGPKG